jgi:hypothetical protein
VFNAKVNSKAISMDRLTTRAKDASATAAAAAQTAAAAAQTAAQTASMAAQAAAHEVSTAAQSAASGASKGVYNARIWAAPRLENAADYTTTTMAPKVSSALRATARQIAPEDMRRKRVRPMLMWSLLGAAVLTGAAAAATLVRQRYRSAMATDTQEEAVGPGSATAGTTNPPASPASGTAESTATSSDTGVNGRVSSSGW